MINFGQKLKEIRKSKNITLLEVEKKTGISNSYLSQVENEKRGIPTFETLKKLADCYEMDLATLLFKSGLIKSETEVKSESFEDMSLIALNLFLDNVTESDGSLKPKYLNHFIDYPGLESINREKIIELFFALNDSEKSLFIRTLLGYENNIINFQPKKATMIEVPILGKITAGLPITTVENIEEYQLIHNKWNYKQDELFLLRVTGDSMINSRIFDGDLVLVKSQNDVENGEIAVVSVDGEEATLKRVKKINGNIILFPDNPRYEPILITNENAKILGKVIQVIFEP